MELGLSDGVKRIIMIVTLAIAVACCAWRAKWTLDAYNDYKSQMAAAEAAIVKTQTDIQAQRQDLTDVNTERNEILANYHELGNAGIQVAQLQTEWANFVYQRSVCQAGDRPYYDGMIHDTEVKLIEYFDEVPFGWYSCRDKDTSWQCVTNYSFYTNTLRTVWLCQSGSVLDLNGRIYSEVYAYATADYRVDTRKFSNVDVRLTTYGLSKLVDASAIEGVDYDASGFPVVLHNGRITDPIGEVVLDIDEVLEDVTSEDIRAILEAGAEASGGNAGSDAGGVNNVMDNFADDGPEDSSDGGSGEPDAGSGGDGGNSGGDSGADDDGGGGSGGAPEVLF